MNKKLILLYILNPFFSILTITKNCEHEIENTLASVKSQTFTNYEHVVVDGCSKIILL